MVNEIKKIKNKREIGIRKIWKGMKKERKRRKKKILDKRKRNLVRK